MYNQIVYRPTISFRGYQSPQIMYSPSLTYQTRTSSLDAIIHNTAIQEQNPHKPLQERKEILQYTSPLAASFSYAQNLETYFVQKQNKEYHAIDGFLKLYRPKTQFIEAAEEIEDLVRETFEKTTGEALPTNIVVSVLDKEDMKRVHEQNGAVWSDSIQGFSINSNGLNPTKQVVVKKADLDKVMIVVGHEIGHVLTAPLPNSHDEEAKAFAFEFAWVETMMKHNIGNLKNNFILDVKPANNGLHDVACSFVHALLKKGKEAIEIYTEIVERMVTLVPAI